jgi:N-acetylglucosaminyldiphosphoundecaprenol N-acetyl-beta-D-mannosaminyltransferase
MTEDRGAGTVTCDPDATSSLSWNRPDGVRILGIPLARVSMASATAAVARLIDGGGGPHLVGVCNTYTAVVAQRDRSLRAFYEKAALNLPDGMPLVWVSRLFGTPIPERVCGPDFMAAFSRVAAARGYRFFLLGARPRVLEVLKRNLEAAAPGLAVVGTYAPPFGSFSNEENRRMVEAVNAARADVLWVGLSAPKQESWLLAMAPRLRVRVGIGVGAAFDLLAGHPVRAPLWMRQAGLEWAHRLAQEPRRLWCRYLIGHAGFAAGVIRDILTGAPRRGPASRT